VVHKPGLGESRPVPPAMHAFPLNCGSPKVKRMEMIATDLDQSSAIL
jgi:hypothetical protein